MREHNRAPALVLGTMTFGKQVDEGTADRILDYFLASGSCEIDTAHDYGKGATEEILGRILTPERRQKIYLATKVNPWGEGGLRPESLRSQLETSLQRLQTDSIDLLYLHAPDSKTPIEITLGACHELFREGRFRELGLSNYAAWQVADIWHICQRNGWILPTVYQGMYNGITRAVEPELIPALRRLGIRFYAFNPLAGGLLTGKHLSIDNYPKEGRFAILDMYAERYWKQGYFEALIQLRKECTQHGIDLTGSALRWILNHSMLTAAWRDTVIIGMSNFDQLVSNMDFAGHGALPDKVCAAYDQAWKVARPVCPPYFRG
jgi:aflatoxin B1 aldehyde reductase